MTEPIQLATGEGGVMAKRVLDRFDRWQANHAARKAAFDSFDSDDQRRLFHLLILEVEGEVSPSRFKRCLDTALKQFQKDRADASSIPGYE